MFNAMSAPPMGVPLHHTVNCVSVGRWLMWTMDWPDIQGSIVAGKPRDTRYHLKNFSLQLL